MSDVSMTGPVSWLVEPRGRVALYLAMLYALLAVFSMFVLPPFAAAVPTSQWSGVAATMAPLVEISPVVAILGLIGVASYLVIAWRLRHRKPVQVKMLAAIHAFELVAMSAIIVWLVVGIVQLMPQVKAALGL